MVTTDPAEPMDTSAEQGGLDISTVSDDHELLEGEELIEVGEYRIKIPLPPSLVVSSGKEGEPRLMITHIENENFKSYAQVQTLGPFHKNFTCIVGPNGSGKSNVIDSMLFVFGYRSQKIRCKKTSVLIHNSDQFNNLDSCRVTVFFQKIVDTGPREHEYNVIPNSGFKVSRVGFKDNSSRYYLNDKATNYKEISIFLRQQGIDLDHNRFLILQGEVESIALMKSKGTTPHEEGMLEFLEDIIGSSRFLSPLGKLEKLLEKLNIERGEKMNRTKLAERDKNELKGARDEAIRYLRTQNTITKLYNKIYQLEKWETESAIEKIEGKLKNAKEKAQPVLDQLAEVQKEKKERDVKYESAVGNYKKLEQEIEELQKTFESFEKKDIEKREEYKRMKLHGKKQAQQLEKEEENRKELETLPETRRKELEELKVLLERTQADKANAEEVLQRAMAAIKDDAAPIVAEKEKRENELIPLRQRVNKAKSKLTIAEDELNLFISNQEREKNKLNSMEAQLDQLNEKVASREAELKELERDVPAEEKELSVAENDLKTVQEREEVLMGQLQRDRGQVEHARSTMRTQTSRKGVLGALMEQKRCGAIPGIYGRLGDLGAIDDKYDVAISTACGPLDNIVVDSVETAQNCIAYLKSSGVGFATFLCLDKQQRFVHKAREPIQQWPEGVPRLFDLVKVNNEDLLPAFYYALQDTLVAKDMEQATRIAYGARRYRVVTLGGGMIEASGAMSGGGNRVSRGRMGSKVVEEEQIDPDELRAMEERLTTMTEEARSCHHRRTQLETRAETLRTSIRTKNLNRKKHQNEVDSLKATQPKLLRQITECEEQIKKLAPDENQLAHLESTVADAKAAYDAEVAAIADSEAKVKQLATKVKETMEGRVKGPKSHVDKLEKQIAKINGDITKTNVAIKTAGRNIVASGEKIESIKKDIEESKERETQLRAELEKLTTEAGAMIEKKEEKIETKKEMKGTLHDLKKEIDKMEKIETDLKAKQQTVMQELEVVESDLASQKDVLKHNVRQLAGLKLNPIDPKMSESVRPDSDDEGDTMELVQFPPEQLATFKIKTLHSEVASSQERLDQMSPNMAAIEEYEKKNRAYVLRWQEFQECTERRDFVRGKLEELKKRRLDEFLEGFQIMNRKLKEMYQTITMGGDAELELEDSLDPFAEGVSFSVRPPKKTWKKITNLSGGEKTLSSLSLVFALHHYKPTPFYVMDEIDAALDFKNVSIVGHYIKERTSNAQFIIISLRNNMFELANRLVGIYKTFNCTKCVALSLENVDEAAAASDAASAPTADAPVRNGVTPSTTTATTNNNNVALSPTASAKIASQSQVSSQSTVASENGDIRDEDF